MITFNIEPPLADFDAAIQSKIDLKTKPVGALGVLETIAFKIAKIQQTLNPISKKPTIVVFAGDHGIAEEGLVNPYPQEVTFQMVLNFIAKGAAINVFAIQNNLVLKIVDAGVNYNFGKIEGLIDAKIAMGTSNYLLSSAMTIDQCKQSLTKGTEIIENIHKEGSNIVGFGEMGIGNTAAAALLMSCICKIPIEDCVGKGTGANKEQLNLKVKTLKQVVEKHAEVNTSNSLEILSTFGGFEIAQMCGGMLKAAELGMLILVDGFISSAAMLVAQNINKNVLEYAIFTHHSNEQGHTKMLAYMNAKPLVNLGMRLGEGSGIAVAYPIIQSASTFFNKMASFDSAQITNKD